MDWWYEIGTRLIGPLILLGVAFVLIEYSMRQHFRNEQRKLEREAEVQRLVFKAMLEREGFYEQEAPE